MNGNGNFFLSATVAGNGECNEPNPIFVAFFSPKIWLIALAPVICSLNCYCKNQILAVPPVTSHKKAFCLLKGL